jgi:hypothetical protein
MPISFEVQLNFDIDRLAEHVKNSVELRLDKISQIAQGLQYA